ncbi:hypothetical protein ABMA27_002233 [Loxostege sticticalis]|uniref:Uncharacterized protein n=1 Tax=Loxostege sticticalis TaxID=481309 RepID=A0ABR3HX28_LOXSC
MFRISVVVLVALIASILAAEQGENTDDQSLYIRKCCKKMALNPDSEAIYDECLETFKTSSDIYKCVATKKGITTPDGKLDVTKVNKYIEDEFRSEGPGLITAIKKACVEGDLSKFGPPDLNEVVKFFNCASYEKVMTCPDEAEDGSCDGGRFLMKRIE